MGWVRHGWNEPPTTGEKQMDNTVITAQGIDAREFWTETQDKPRLEKVLTGFLAGVEKQTGTRPEVLWGDDYMVAVDMSGWPEDEPFGDWFDELMEEHAVYVCD